MLDIKNVVTLFDVPITVDDFIGKLFPNGFLGILTQLLAFFVMVAIVTYFGYKPIKKVLNARKNYVENQIQSAEKANAEAESRELISRQTILASKKEAEIIVNDAKLAGEKVKEEILNDAKNATLEEKAKTEKEIALAKAKAIQEIEQEIVSVALEASKVVVGREINIEDNSRLVQDFIKEVKQ